MNTTIRRAKKDADNPYKSMRRATFEDSRLTWEARGMIAYLLVKPDDWRVNPANLVNESPGGRDKVYRIINELIEFGYILRKPVRDELGRRVGYEYLVFEEPQSPTSTETGEEPSGPFPEKPYTGKPETVKPETVEPCTEKPDITKKEEVQSKNSTKKENYKGGGDVREQTAHRSPAKPAAPPPVMEQHDSVKESPYASGSSRARLQAGLFDPRKLLKSKTVRKETGQTPCEVMFEFIPYNPERISVSTLEKVDQTVTDLGKWRAILAEVDGLGWQLYNINDRLDVYRNGFKHKKGKGNANSNTNQDHGCVNGKHPAARWAEREQIINMPDLSEFGLGGVEASD